MKRYIHIHVRLTYKLLTILFVFLPLTAHALGAIVIIDDVFVHFKDIENDWYKEDAIRALQKGIMTEQKDEHGNNAGTFGPHDPVTVAKALEVSVKAAGYNLNQYDDVQHTINHWSARYIAVALAERFSFILSSPDFEQSITRGQLASLIVSAFKVRPIQVTGTVFSDLSSQHPHAIALETLAFHNVISSKNADGSQKKANADAVVTRGMLAKFVMSSQDAFGLVQHSDISKKEASLPEVKADPESTTPYKYVTKTTIPPIFDLDTPRGETSVETLVTIEPSSSNEASATLPLKSETNPSFSKAAPPSIFDLEIPLEKTSKDTSYEEAKQHSTEESSSKMPDVFDLSSDYRPTHKNIEPEVRVKKSSSSSSSAKSSAPSSVSSISSSSVSSVQKKPEIPNYVTAIVDGAEREYSDVERTAWFADSVKKAIEMNLMTGYENNGAYTFGSLKDVTIAEVLKVAVVAAGYNVDKYKDVQHNLEHWVAPYYSVGLKEKFPVVLKNPDMDSLATREQVASLFAHAFKLQLTTPKGTIFTDLPASNIHAAEIEALYSAGAMTGDRDSNGNMVGTVRPKDTIVRAGVAKIAVTMIELFGSSAGQAEPEALEEKTNKLAGEQTKEESSQSSESVSSKSSSEQSSVSPKKDSSSSTSSSSSSSQQDSDASTSSSSSSVSSISSVSSTETSNENLAPFEVVYNDYGFLPSEISVKQGQAIKFYIQGSAALQFETFRDFPAEVRADRGYFPDEGSYEVVMPMNGRYVFRNKVRPGHTGVITVR